LNESSDLVEVYAINDFLGGKRKNVFGKENPCNLASINDYSLLSGRYTWILSRSEQKAM
jgi:hypothetical protein